MKLNETNETSKARLLLVDDHEMTLDVLKEILGSLPDLLVVGAAHTGEEAVELSRTIEPDLVLMDLMLPGIDGVEATRRILAERPNTRVAFLSMYIEEENICRAREAGASAYLFKIDSSKRLIPCLRAIIAGKTDSGSWFPSAN